jgi:segregation and condensation protein A
MTTTYRVELADYTGPLDLLLYLVRRNEVDVVRLPISRIASQFLEFLDVLQFLDFDIIGDFVVMASTLMEIKSRLVLPQPEDDTPDDSPVDDDPRSELITRLLEYKRYRDAAVALDQRAVEWQQRFPRLSHDRPVIGRDHAADPIREVELWDLVSALSRVLQKRVVEQTSSIRYDGTPQQVYMEHIAQQVQKAGRLPFSSFFDGTNQRSKIIGLFLAILELLRHHGFRAEQPQAYGEIFVLPPAHDAASQPEKTVPGATAASL